MGETPQFFWENMVKTDKCMSISRFLGGLQNIVYIVELFWQNIVYIVEIFWQNIVYIVELFWQNIVYIASLWIGFLNWGAI